MKHRNGTDEAAAAWLVLNGLWRFSTGRQLLADIPRPADPRRAAARWAVVALIVGLVLDPAVTVAAAVAFSVGFAVGALWAAHPDRPPAARNHLSLVADSRRDIR